MENNQMTFIFDNEQINVITFNDSILFNPYQIGSCLDLKSSAVRMAIGKMNNNQVIKLLNSDVKGSDIRKLNNAGENFLTESGVYKLIFKSQKPDAERFQDWITDEVLPQVRKTGGYIPMQQVNNTPMTDEQIMAQAYIIATNTIKLRDQELAAMQTTIAQKECDLVIASDKIEELEPKGDYYDTILKSDKGINISTIADDYKLSGAALNQLLCQWGIQYKRGERYFLYAKYKGLDYVVSEVHPGKHKDGTPANFSHMKWTEIGRRFIYNIMKDHGYLTRAEQVDAKTVKAISWNERAVQVGERVEQTREIETQIGIDIQIV